MSWQIYQTSEQVPVQIFDDRSGDLKTTSVSNNVYQIFGPGYSGHFTVAEILGSWISPDQKYAVVNTRVNLNHEQAKVDAPISRVLVLFFPYSGQTQGQIKNIEFNNDLVTITTSHSNWTNPTPQYSTETFNLRSGLEIPKIQI